MRGLRKVLRAIAIFVLAISSVYLFGSAALYGPADDQLALAAVLLLGGLGVTATWFWSPFGQ
jgi:hypothetical protein